MNECEYCPQRDCCQSYIRTFMRPNRNRIIMEHYPDAELSLGVELKIGNQIIGRITSVVLRSDGSVHLVLDLEEEKMIARACQKGAI